MIIPFDHPIYPFPYNIEDRILYIINNINKITNQKNNYNVKEKNNEFTMCIENHSKLSMVKHILDKYNFVLEKNHYVTILK
jgi:hypothetical protein